MKTCVSIFIKLYSLMYLYIYLVEPVFDLWQGGEFVIVESFLIKFFFISNQLVFYFKSKYFLFWIKNGFELRFESKFYHLLGFIMFNLNQFVNFNYRVGYVRVTYQRCTFCNNMIELNCLLPATIPGDNFPPSSPIWRLLCHTYALLSQSY